MFVFSLLCDEFLCIYSKHLHFFNTGLLVQLQFYPSNEIILKDMVKIDCNSTTMKYSET